MESTDPEHYQVALVLPMKTDYETAVKLLDECFAQRSLDSSGAEYSLGKAGSHHLVLVTGLSNVSAAESVASVVPDLLKEYPSIRAGFLIGVDAVSASDEPVRVVVGMPQGHESALVQFDADKSRCEKRLHIMGHLPKPPLFVNPAVDDTLSTRGRDEWHMYLDKHLPTMSHSNEPKVRKGRVGSSNTALRDPELLQRLASDNGILCFETAAANVQSRLPLVVVCGVNQGDPSLSRQENANKLAAAYAMFLARHLKPAGLAKGVRLGQLFNHQPFSLGGSTIRLLRLHGGTDYPIQCSMFEAHLRDQHGPMDYEALSYAWGSGDTCEMINVDGRVLYIKNSLYGALQHLRHRRTDRILWADAICIDQSNIMERGHQVAQMGTIYKKATNVIVWLGSVETDAGLLISALRNLQLKVSPQPIWQWQPGDDRWRVAWEELHGGDISGGPSHLRLINGLRELMAKSWFTRVWILQEVANARSAQIQCSAGTIDAMLLALAPRLLGDSIPEQPQAVLEIFPGLPRKSSWWAKDRTLGALLWKFRHCQATDPRDRVYALLGIASDMANGAIEPDYSKSEYQILGDTCSYLFDEEQFARLWGPRRIEELQRELPTWAGAVLEWKMIQGVKPHDLERFLDRQSRVKWTKTILELSSFDLGHSTLDLLLNKIEAPVPITPELFRQAFRRGSDALDLLIDKFTDKDGNLESLVLAAAKAGEHAMDTVYEKCNIPAGIANDMIGRMVSLPLAIVKRLYLGRWRHEFEISESATVKIAQARLDILEIFLWGETGKLQITEAALRQAKLSNDPLSYRFLKTMRSSEVDVSEEEAIRAIKGGPDTLRRCLDKPGTNFRVTETIFKTAMLSGADVAEMLFRRRESEVNIHQEVQEIYQLRQDLRDHVLEILGRTENTAMLREAVARYESLINSQPVGSATAALGQTTDIVQELRSAGVCVSRWRTVHEIFRELIAGKKNLDIGSGSGADELKFQGDSGGDADVEKWEELRRRIRRRDVELDDQWQLDDVFPTDGETLNERFLSL